MVVSGIQHSEGFVNVLAKEVFILLARYPLDDITQQKVSRVAIGETLAWREVQLFVSESCDRSQRRHRKAFVLVVVREVCKAGDARRMSKEMADGDRSPRFRAVFDVLADRIRQPNLSALREDHDSHGGKLLGYGSEPKFCLKFIGNSKFPVGEAVCFLEQHTPITRH